MPKTGSVGRVSLTRRAVLAAAGTGLALPALLKPAPACAADPITLTVWSWITRQQDEIDLYRKLNPGIHVDFVNAGQGPGEYIKLRHVEARPKPYGGSRPVIMNAGASSTGQAFAVRN